VHRRTLLRLPAIGALGAAGLSLTACSEEPDVPESRREKRSYGDDPSQYGELFRPSGASRGTVVVVHGGFWQAQYTAEDLGTPLAIALADAGWTAWNLEYRRVGEEGADGAGGGTPATFDDVSAGIDLLTDLDVDLSLPVVTLGHSAGGLLAVWAAGRGRYGWPDAVPVTHAISQAGVLDLRASEIDNLGGGAARMLLGHEPTVADERFDPAQQLPLDVPVWCVHGTDDAIVPLSQSERYVERATAAGGTAELVEVDGDHFVVIDVESDAWARQLEILDSIA
jgi:acetyl esterase/lipase